jgi:hypothetical protein
VKRDSRLRVKSGRRFDDVDDQRLAGLTNKPHDRPEAVVIAGGPAGRPTKEDTVRYFDHYVQRRRLTAAGRGRCAAREPNRRGNRFTSKEVNAVPMPTNSAGVDTELMKTRYDARVFTVTAI